MYTDENLAAFDIESKEVYFNVMGPCFDFRTAAYNPVIFGIGGYVSSCGMIMLPYVIGLNDTDPNNPTFDYLVAFDNKNFEFNNF